jgi:hypothetical protein
MLLLETAERNDRVFKKLADAWRARVLVKQVEKHPVSGLVLSHLRNVLNDRSQGLGQHWSEEGKQKLVGDLLADIDQQLLQPDPTLAVRMRTIEFMLLASSFDVLVMQHPSKFSGISGELKLHIPKLATLNTDLREFFYSMDPTPTEFNDMWDAVLLRYWVLHLYMSSYQVARVALGDYHSDATKDWFRPCYMSFCIWHENTYRQELGLPSVVAGDQPDLRAIMHSTWMNRAQEGHKELRLVWEDSWIEIFHEPSPFAGLALQ